MAAGKNSAPQTSVMSMGWPKSGWRTSAVTVAPSTRSANVFAGISGFFADSANSQAIRITKAGLRNSDGWMLTPASPIQRRAPLTSAPTKGDTSTITKATASAPRARYLGADEGRRQHHHEGDRKDDEGEAADVARREERGREHHGERRHEVHRLAMHEVEWIEPEPRRDRRARGERQDEPGQHQRDQRRQHRPVDGPPPGRKRRALGARNHETSLRSGGARGAGGEYGCRWVKEKLRIATGRPHRNGLTTTTPSISRPCAMSSERISRQPSARAAATIAASQYERRCTVLISSAPSMTGRVISCTRKRSQVRTRPAAISCGSASTRVGRVART